MTFVPSDRVVSLSVATTGSEDFFGIFQDLSELARNLGVNHNYVSVTTTLVDDDEDPHDEPAGEDLYYDDNTLEKVREVMMNCGLTGDVVIAVINDLQNAGILFRERLPS